MKEFLYEMHLHTFPCSKCGHAPIGEMIEGAAAAGLSGIVLTNHFYRGNSGIDRTLPWEDFVGAYRDDYLEGCRLGKRAGIDVHFGLECGVGDGKEVLVYGLPPAFFAAHPEFREMGAAELSVLVREAGGLVYHAHPFRERPYIPDPDAEPDPALYDGIEIYNAGNPDDQNDRAAAFADRYGLPGISGGDLHRPTGFGRAGILTDTRLRDAEDLCAVLRSREYTCVVGGEARAMSEKERLRALHRG